MRIGVQVTIPSPLGKNFAPMSNSKSELLPTDYDPITTVSGSCIN